MVKERDGLFEGEAVLLLNKGKRGLLRVVFGRTLLLMLLLSLQVGLLIAAFLRLEEYYYGSALTASLMVSLLVINKPGDATAKITWILLIFLVPVLSKGCVRVLIIWIC